MKVLMGPEAAINAVKWGASSMLALAGILRIQLEEIPFSSEIFSTGALGVLAGVIYMLLNIAAKQSAEQSAVLRELHRELETLRRILETRK